MVGLLNLVPPGNVGLHAPGDSYEWRIQCQYRNYTCTSLTAVRTALQLVLTTKSQQEAAKDALPVSYEKLPSMVEVGDEIFLGRYLVTGAEEASLFLEVGVLPVLWVRCHQHPLPIAAARSVTQTLLC